MNILIVNYFYPPTIDAHAYRWEQIARLWVENGHHVDVLTGRVEGIQNYSVESGVHVTRVGIVAKSLQTTPNSKHSVSMVLQARKRLLDALRPFYRKIYWPDSMWHWLPSLALEVVRRKHSNYDLVISYYPCLAAHIAVAMLKYISNRSKFTWIADYGDPFSSSLTMQPNNFSLYNHLNKIVERWLLTNANNVVFTNEATATAYKINLRLSGNVSVIPHLVNIDNYYSIQPAITDKGKHDLTTSLYYVGGFHRNIREPDRLFNLIRALNQNDSHKFVLKVYGPLNGFDLSELSPVDCPQIIYMGIIGRSKAIEIIKNADIIINIDNENCIMTPSKIVECISSGRPIINLSNEKTFYSPLERYASLGYALFLKESIISNETVGLVKNFIKSHSSKKSAPLYLVEDILKSHMLKTVADQYMIFKI